MLFDTVPTQTPTQPMRYTDSPVAPIISSSGSTLLHFAVANGHTNAVRALVRY
jgi:ankyrin repeat protein